MLMSSQEKTIYDDLNFPDHQAKAIKNLAYSHNLFLKDGLELKNLKIDDRLSIVNRTTEEKAVIFLAGFARHELRTSNLKGTFLLYKYGDKHHSFEAEDRVRTFITAVRIFKNSWCSANFSFTIGEQRKFYRPFNLTSQRDEIFYGRKNTSIRSQAELNKIKRIHRNLHLSGFENHLHYSKLSNATRFFNRSYEEVWTLMKTTLAFTALESLFSDSSKTEVTYKVALRTANFLHPKDFNKKLEVFNLIKRGYDIRSYFVHGSDVEKRIDKLMKTFEEEKDSDYWFHVHFIDDLMNVASLCLQKILLDEKYFNFFSNTKINQKEEAEFYEKLSLGGSI